MRVIIGGQYYSTPDGSSIRYTHSMSDPVPTAQINIKDNFSAYTIQVPQEILVIDDQQIPNPTQNMLLNPGMLPYTTNWTVGSFSGITLSQNGGGGLVATISNAPIGTSKILSQLSTSVPWYPVAGQAYIFSVYVQGSSSPTQFQAAINVNWYDFAGNRLSGAGYSAASVSTTLTRYVVQTTAPANVGYVGLELDIQTAFASSSGVVTFTQAQFEPVWFPTVTYPTVWCGPSQTNCRQLPLGYYIRQYRKFAGFVTKVSPGSYHGNARTIQLNAVGYAWLCDTIIGNDAFTSKTDAQIITSLVNKYLLSNGVAMTSTANVITGVSVSSLQLNWDTLRTVFDGLAALSTFYWTIDEYWNVIYAPPGYLSMGIQLICDSSSQPDFVTTFPGYEFLADNDFTQPGSNILIFGNGANTAQVIDPSRVAQIGILTGYQLPTTSSWMRKINDSTLGATADCTQRGMAELLQYDFARGIYHLKTNQELLAGQGVRVTSSTDGLNQSMLLIQQVTAQWIGTNETLTDMWEYQSDLGAINRTATHMISRIFRRTNTNSAATAIASTTLAVIENVTVTDTIDSNSMYAMAVLSDSPYAYYRLGEPTGFSITSAYDWSGNAYNGTINGTVTLGQTGAIYNDPNTSMLFDGATGYISLPSATNGNGLGAFSVEVWADLSSASLGSTTEIIASGTSAAHTGYQLLWNGTSSLQFLVGNGATTATASYTTTPVAGAWWHIVGTYDGANIRLYVNGVLSATAACSGTISASLNPTIAASTLPASFFPGGLDEVALYASALSSARVLTHWRVGTRANPYNSHYAALILAASPQAYYRLGEASGTAADSSGHLAGAAFTGTVSRAIPGAIVDDLNGAAGFNNVGAVNMVSTDYSYSALSILFWIRLSGDWKFVAITSNGTTTLTYFNGVAGSNDGDPTHDPIYVGKLFDSLGSPAAGQIDEIALFNYVLTPAQIQAFYTTATA